MEYMREKCLVLKDFLQTRKKYTFRTLRRRYYKSWIKRWSSNTINFLKSIRNIVRSDSSNKKVNMTVKWDGTYRSSV